jgi:predicted ATP-dependent protease
MYEEVEEKKKIQDTPENASKYWQYASEKARNDKKSKKSRRRARKKRTRNNKAPQDIRMSINPFQPFKT